MRIHVQPELRLPKQTDAGFQWDLRDSVHPFWFMRRADQVVGAAGEAKIAANASVVMETVKQVWASEYQHLNTAKADVDPMVATFSVKLPCIVNAAPIKAGEEAVVQWQVAPTKKKAKAATTQTAFDQIAASQRKRPRGTK